MSKHREAIIRVVEESIAVKQAVAGELTDEIEMAADWVVDAFKQGGKLLAFGNGGSAADAQHIVAELVGKFDTMERKALPAIALTTNTSTLTSASNDYGFERVFVRQVEAFADPKTVVLGISTSGNSPNVVQAIQAAKAKGARTIGLSGRDGGELGKVVDLALKVPSESTPRIQEAHITIGHIICQLVEQELFADQDDEVEDEP